MPEGPEVRITGEQLSETLRGRILTDITINDKSKHFSKKPLALLETFKQALPLTLLGMGVKGKKIIFFFEYNYSFVSSLGMEGKWLYEERKHSGIILSFGEFRLFYDDTRHFGELEIFNSSESLVTRMKEVGPDLLAEDLSLETWTNIITKKGNRNKKIGSLLLDQKQLSGIGNYLRSEILYRSRVSPWRTVGSLSQDQLTWLWYYSLLIIRESYHAGGLTIRSYLSPKQEPGRYQCQVYSRSYTVEGHPVIQDKNLDGQTVWWCKELQS